MSDLLQVVVVSSGTNDWHSLPPMYDLEEWVAQAVAFLREVSTALMACDATFLNIHMHAQKQLCTIHSLREPQAVQALPSQRSPQAGQRQPA